EEGRLLTAAPFTIYTAPVAAAGSVGPPYVPPTLNTKAIITQLTFSNFDAVQHTATVALVKKDMAAGTTNQYSAYLAPAGDPARRNIWACVELLGATLEPGDFVQVFADVANEVNVTMSVEEIS